MVLEINLSLIKKYEEKSTKRQTRASDSDQILKVVFHVPEKTRGVFILGLNESNFAQKILGNHHCFFYFGCFW